MIATLDSQVIEKFKEFQNKTGKYIYLNIEEIQFNNLSVDLIFDIVRRGASPRPIKKYQVDKNYQGIKYNWLKIGDVTKSNVYLKETNEYINEDGKNRSVLGKKGDFLITNSMTVGVPVILDIEACFHDGFLYLGFNDKEQNKYNNLYLFYFFTSFRQTLISKSKDGIVKNLNTDIIKTVSIPIPQDYNEQYKSIDIQKAIVEFLEFWKINYTNIFIQTVNHQKPILEKIKKALIPATIRYDRTIVSSFNEFVKSKKDIRLEEIEFKKIDFFTIKKNDLLSPKKLEKNQDLILQNSSNNGYPVYSGAMEALCKVNELRYSNKIFIPNQENPDISFANNGDGSAGRNFFVHTNRYFVNQERTVISFKNDNEYYSLYILNQIINMREKYNMNRENRPTPKDLLKLGIEITIPFHHTVPSFEIQKILVEFWEMVLNNIDERFAKFDNIERLTDKIDEAFLYRTFSKIEWREK